MMGVWWTLHHTRRRHRAQLVQRLCPQEERANLKLDLVRIEGIVPCRIVPCDDRRLPDSEAQAVFLSARRSYAFSSMATSGVARHGVAILAEMLASCPSSTTLEDIDLDVRMAAFGHHSKPRRYNRYRVKSKLRLP